MKTAKLLCWAKMPNDSRHTASVLVALVVPQAGALGLAREIETHGMAANLPECVLKALPEKCRLVGGHGIDVVYASGRTRKIAG